jgi:hypothetical protein
MNMDFWVPVFAWFSIGLGIFTLIYRMIHPAFFLKLGMMQKVFGPGWGYLLHFVAYTVVPLVIGASLILTRHQGAML